MMTRRAFSVRLPRRLSLLGLPLLLVSALTAADAPIPAQVSYNRDVRPILSDKCFSCHGPDKNTRKAKLRLDVESEAKHERDGYLVLNTQNVSESELLKRISTTDTDDVMPPLDARNQLTEREKEILKRWIEQGAKYEPHWAYLPVERSQPPTLENPSAPVRNDIDRFLQARLAQEGLSPAAEANRATLIRRLTFDLTGLPPKPEEVRAFEQDTSAEAYGKLVERLLHSPHYGERMAQYWLDLVRYADTVGYHGDGTIEVWPYRDYVIKAFNTNQRFDQFTREQLAGDLLPNASQEQRVASGYNKLGMMSTEGGIQDKEYRAKYAGDRVRTASTVWMGATLGCAECHDHKFDPYSAKDFYSFAAFFADLNEQGFYADGFDRGNWGPKMLLTDAEQKKQLAELDAAIKPLRQTIDAFKKSEVKERVEQWAKDTLEVDRAGNLGWKEQQPFYALSTEGATLTIRDDNSVWASGHSPNTDTYIVSIPAPLGRITAIRLETLSDESLAGNRVARNGQYFVVNEIEGQVRHGQGDPKPLKFKFATSNKNDDGYPVLAVIDGDDETGWAPFYGHTGNHKAVLFLDKPIEGGPNSTITLRIKQLYHRRQHTIGGFKLSLSAYDTPHHDGGGIPENVLKAVREEPAKRNDDQKNALVNYYRGIDPRLMEERKQLAALEAKRSLLTGHTPTMLVAEATTPRTMRILPRGNWMDDSGEEVKPAVPHFMPGPAADERRLTRLDLANWLVSADNPLTARVYVNRLWKQFFGIGLSKSVDDIGAQGEAPVHPELLDWLASEFVASGWDTKHVVKLVVLSHAYRQSSASNATLEERDPYNRFVARQSRFRLDAEFVRDNALAIAGLLEERVGGPSVFPYQPAGYWSPLNFPKRDWANDTGENLYRRGLYTHWQRTFLHPSLRAFDAPTREECTAYRTTSNTPLQALVLLNDPIYVEAARVFAGRILQNGGKDFATRLEYAFTRALSRAPLASERDILHELYVEQYARYLKDKGEAQALVNTGEAPITQASDVVDLAAWTSVSRAILNLHETITRN